VLPRVFVVLHDFDGFAVPEEPHREVTGGCMGACDAQHASCRARCGPEPTESSAYDGYARCQGQCLRDASRCRLGCR
jgi:hypothetical protein